MIVLKNVTKTFAEGKAGEVAALKNINLHVKKSELVILRGPSGSGKSTMLSIMAALIRPTSGEVIIEQRSIAKLPDSFASLFRREHIGFIFQKFNLIGELSVYENVILPLVPTALSSKEIDKMAQEVMEKFKIAHKQEVLAKNLSGGEQQRVAIARALVNNPKIILADEPTANLDSALSLEFLEIVRLLRQEGKTIVIATHDPIFFDVDFIDRIVDVSNGEIR